MFSVFVDPFQDGKCDWIGEYGTYQKHIEVCKNVPLAPWPVTFFRSCLVHPGYLDPAPVLLPALLPQGLHVYKFLCVDISAVVTNPKCVYIRLNIYEHMIFTSGFKY